ncbi:hypothetical protein BJX63DRAFT_413917, partial [Aspergillus granulosus]
MKVNIHTTLFLLFALLFTLVISSPIEESETEDIKERDFEVEDGVAADPGLTFDIRSPKEQTAPQATCPKPNTCRNWDFRECRCRDPTCPKPNDCRDWDFRDCRCRDPRCPKPNDCRDWDFRDCRCRDRCPKPNNCRETARIGISGTVGAGTDVRNQTGATTGTLGIANAVIGRETVEGGMTGGVGVRI